MGEVDQFIDKEADLLPWPQLLARPLQDFPGPPEHRGEMRGQAWAGWETGVSEALVMRKEKALW